MDCLASLIAGTRFGAARLTTRCSTPPLTTTTTFRINKQLQLLRVSMLRRDASKALLLALVGAAAPLPALCGVELAVCFLDPGSRISDSPLRPVQEGFAAAAGAQAVWSQESNAADLAAAPFKAAAQDLGRYHWLLVVQASQLVNYEALRAALVGWVPLGATLAGLAVPSLPRR